MKICLELSGKLETTFWVNKVDVNIGLKHNFIIGY